MPYYSGITCIDSCVEPSIYWVNTDNVLTAGSVVGTDQEKCFVVSGETTSSIAYSATFAGNPLGGTGYTSCIDCINDRKYYYYFQDCKTGEFYPFLPSFDNNIFSNGIPQIGCVYNVSLNTNLYQYNGCATVFSYQPYEGLKEPFEGRVFSISTSYGPGQAGCELCNASRTFIYECRPCLNLDPRPPKLYIELQSDSYEKYTATANITGYEGPYCIEIGGIVPSGTINVTPIQILGPTSKEINCNTCNNSINKKRILYDCLDPDNQIVVWGSPSFESGDVTHIQVSGFCWTVGAITEANVTFSEFAEFTPCPTCNDCIRCNGVTLVLRECPDGDVYKIDTYKLQDIGTVIYTPMSGCSIVEDILEFENANEVFYSFHSTTIGCSQCEIDSENFYSYFANLCTTNETIVITSTLSSLSPGDFIKVYWQDVVFACAEITGLYDGSTGYDNYKSFDDNQYNNCEECTQNGNVGITLIKCDNSEQMYVTASLSLYQLLYLYPVISIGASCWRLLNDCPLDSIYPNLTPFDYFLNCQDCSRPREAGNEYNLCLIDCSGNTYSVNVQHPVWTDLQGKSVLQLDAIQLGGINGYYS